MVLCLDIFLIQFSGDGLEEAMGHFVLIFPVIVNKSNGMQQYFTEPTSRALSPTMLLGCRGRHDKHSGGLGHRCPQAAQY